MYAPLCFVVVVFWAKQFLFLVSQTPYFALNVMLVLARRLRSANGATEPTT
jgi:CRP-like cAMP-binding protein